MNSNEKPELDQLPRRRRSLPAKLGFQPYEWLAIGVFALLLSPFWAPALLAFITACGLQPVIRRLEQRLPIWKGSGAFSIVSLLAVALIGSTSYMGVRVARLTVEFAAGGGKTKVTAEKEPEKSPERAETSPEKLPEKQTAEDARTAQTGGEKSFSVETIRELRRKLMSLASRWIPTYRKDIESFMNTLPKTAVAWLATRAQGFVSNTLGILFNLGFYFIFLFLFLSKGKTAIRMLLRRLPDSRPRILLWYKLAERASYTSVVSAAAIGFIQASIVTVVCVMLGYSEWGLIFFGCFVLSFAPMLGPAAVPFVLSVWALIGGDTTSALWLALLCAFVGSIDNVLRAWMTAGDEDGNQLLAFVALIGAITLFGFPGLLMGPFLVSLAAMLMGERAREGFRPL